MLAFLGLDSFDINKLRPHLKMAVQRIGIATNKKTQAIKISQREVAKLLSEGKEEKAAIRVEAIIREDATIEALGIIELLCDLIHERARLLEAEKACPEDLKPAVATLIYAANRADIVELHEVKKQFLKKYGKEWVERQEQDADHLVNERVVHKLGIRPPSAALVQKYLTQIAKDHNVQWTPTEKPLTEEQMAWQSMPAPSGASVPMAPATGFSSLYSANQRPAAPGAVPNPLPPPPSNANNKGGGGGGGGGGGLDIPAAPTTMPVATPISPAHGSGKEGFVPPPAPSTAPAQPPVVAAVPLTPPPAPSAPAEEEAPDSTSAVYDIPLPPTDPPVAPAPELPPPPPTSGSGDHLDASGSGSGSVEDLESRFNRLKSRR